jgi:hypothetical protein
MDIGAFPDTFNPAENPQALAFALFGLGALTYAKHPEGIIEFQTTKSIERVNRRRQRRQGRAGSQQEDEREEVAV